MKKSLIVLAVLSALLLPFAVSCSSTEPDPMPVIEYVAPADPFGWDFPEYEKMVVDKWNLTGSYVTSTETGKGVFSDMASLRLYGKQEFNGEYGEPGGLTRAGYENPWNSDMLLSDYWASLSWENLALFKVLPSTYREWVAELVSEGYIEKVEQLLDEAVHAAYTVSYSAADGGNREKDSFLVQARSFAEKAAELKLSTADLSMFADDIVLDVLTYGDDLLDTTGAPVFTEKEFADAMMLKFVDDLDVMDRFGIKLGREDSDRMVAFGDALESIAAAKYQNRWLSLNWRNFFLDGVPSDRDFGYIAPVYDTASYDSGYSSSSSSIFSGVMDMADDLVDSAIGAAGVTAGGIIDDAFDIGRTAGSIADDIVPDSPSPFRNHWVSFNGQVGTMSGFVLEAYLFGDFSVNVGVGSYLFQPVLGYQAGFDYSFRIFRNGYLSLGVGEVVPMDFITGDPYDPGAPSIDSVSVLFPVKVKYVFPDLNLQVYGSVEPGMRLNIAGESHSGGPDIGFDLGLNVGVGYML